MQKVGFLLEERRVRIQIGQKDHNLSVIILHVIKVWS